MLVGLFVSFTIIAFTGISHAGQCFISKDCFAVIQPYMLESVCYLYYHEIRMPDESNMVQTMGDINLHPDPLHVTFVKMMQEKKFVSFKKGTPIFSCGYDLELAKKNDLGGSDTEIANLPESSCRGVSSKMIAVRPSNFNTCYWVAYESVICHENNEWPLLGGSEVRIEGEDEK